MTVPPDGDPSYQSAPHETYWQQHPQQGAPPQWQQPPPGYGSPGYGYPGPGYPGYGYPPPYPGYAAAGPPPSTNLGWAIAAIILFWPLGIPALIYSTRVESQWFRGDASGAMRSSAIARNCGIWAVVATVVLMLLFFILFAAVWSNVDTCVGTGC
jgi:hypothetical protein